MFSAFYFAFHFHFYINLKIGIYSVGLALLRPIIINYPIPLFDQIKLNMRAIPVTPIAGSLTKAAIVTCGGICPGVNNVVSELANFVSNFSNNSDLIAYRDGFLGICNNDFITLSSSGVRYWDT